MTLPWWLNPWREVREQRVNVGNLTRQLNVHRDDLERVRKDRYQFKTELAQLKRDLGEARKQANAGWRRVNGRERAAGRQ